MPSAIEAFVAAQLPGTERIELCHSAQHIVVRRNGPPLSERCLAQEGDTVIPLD